MIDPNEMTSDYIKNELEKISIEVDCIKQKKKQTNLSNSEIKELDSRLKEQSKLINQIGKGIKELAKKGAKKDTNS